MKYGQMQLSVEYMTPAIAERWLKQSNTNNRRLRKAVVSQYARDMKEGRWHAKPLAVCWDVDEKLGNGQHTLSAIAESGVAQWLLVARNVPIEAIAAMDMGLRRTIADIAHFVGKEMESRKAAVARVLAYGPEDHLSRSFDELFAVYEQHAEKIDHICEIAPKRAGFSASSIAVFVRAAYTNDMSRIDRFIEVVRSGIVSGPEETAAIKIRDFCLSLRTASSYSVRREVYQKTESALSSFLAGKPMTKVYGSSVELFPLPTE